MCGQTFAAANVPPLLLTAIRMSWPAPNPALSVPGLRPLVLQTVTHWFFTGKFLGSCWFTFDIMLTCERVGIDESGA